MADFIHIGHGKCASTSLQELWYASSNYYLLRPDEAVDPIRKAAAEARKTGKLADFQVNFQFPDEERFCVISSEAMVYGFASGDEVSICQLLMAKTFCKYSDKALLIVRNPIDWIKSAYGQLINEGGKLSFNEYLVEYEGNYLANLDLSHILNCWISNGVDVTVLPLEFLKSNSEKFWELYSRGLGVDVPVGAEELRRDNQSQYKSLELRRHLNRLFDDLASIASKNEMPDVSYQVKQMHEMKKWALRRAIEVMDVEDANLIRSYLNLSDEELCGNFSISNIAKDHLYSNFIESLRSCDFDDDMLNGYMKSIEQHSM